MHIFACPFCGPRVETEFSFAAEAGKTRPEPAAEVSAVIWAKYLHANANPKGATREIWVHLTCGEFFLMERDSVTHAVAGSTALRSDNP
jgi:heterotetrameric sarcosine oxidase delta subunit